MLLREQTRFVHTLNTDWLPDGFAGYRLGAGVGGWSERGETPWQTAVREAQEETETMVRPRDAPRTWLIERGCHPVELVLDERPAPVVVSRFPNTLAGGDAYGFVFLGEHTGTLRAGDDVAALLLLPPHLWPESETRLDSLVEAGAVVVGDVDPHALVWPHPDDLWRVVRALLPK